MNDDDDFSFTFTQDDSDIPEEMKSRIEEESFSLATGRMYIVFDPSDIDSVTVRAYDTTDTQDVSPAHVLMQGMLSLLETDYDYLMQLGHEATIDQIVQNSKEDTKKLVVEEVYDNVIKVKFSEDN